MLTLAATNTIAGKAQTNSTVTVTIFGMELLNGAETYKVLYQGQPTTSAATLYTVPASTQTFVKSIHVVNTAGTAQTVTFYINGTGNGQRISPDIALPANGFALYGEDGWRVYSSSGRLLSTPSPLTTKGDLFGYSSAEDRLAIGGNGALLVADSAQALGLRWPTDEYRLENITILTTTTAQTYTVPAGVRALFVEAIGGGGGGGGGASSANSASCAGGGGSGAYCSKWFTSLGGSYSYQCGARGDGATAGNNAGSNGSSTTFSTLTAPGGTGGAGGGAAGTSVTTANGGAGASAATGGDYNAAGNAGDPGIRASGTVGWAGSGGPGLWGTGSGNGRGSHGAGNSATGYGAGGGGGNTLNGGGTTAGGNGTQGAIIVWEYA